MPRKVLIEKSQIATIQKTLQILTNMSVSKIVTLNQNKNKFTKKKATSINRMIRKYTKKLLSSVLKDILTLNQKEKILLRTTK